MHESTITVPVLFLVFNRPDKTRRVFDVIRDVKPSKLYVAADAPREHVASDMARCAAVREIVTDIDWKCDAKYLFHEKNLGCSLAGKTAWDWIFSQEEEMIFIEDDGLVSRSFFWYCQELLNRYRGDPRIAYIGGVNYGPKYGEKSYFFSRHGCGTYAMATWKRVYELYEYKMESYGVTKRSSEFRKSFPSLVSYLHLCGRFDEYVRFGGNTYDIQMVYLVHKHRMFWIVPNVSLASNIGFDFDGSNTAVDPRSDIALLLGNRPRFEIEEIHHPDEIVVDREFESRYFEFRSFYGKPWLPCLIKSRLRPYLTPGCRAGLKRFLGFLGLKPRGI